MPINDGFQLGNREGWRIELESENVRFICGFKKIVWAARENSES